MNSWALSEIGALLSAFSAGNALDPRFKAKCPSAAIETAEGAGGISTGLGAFSVLNLEFRVNAQVHSKLSYGTFKISKFGISCHFYRIAGLYAFG